VSAAPSSQPTPEQATRVGYHTLLDDHACLARQNALRAYPRKCPTCGRMTPDDPDNRKALA